MYGSLENLYQVHHRSVFASSLCCGNIVLYCGNTGLYCEKCTALLRKYMALSRIFTWHFLALYFLPRSVAETYGSFAEIEGPFAEMYGSFENLYMVLHRSVFSSSLCCGNIGLY